MSDTPALESQPKPDLEDDDEVESSRAPLLEHLIELRKRLIWCMVFLIAGAGVCFAFRQDLYTFLVAPMVNVAQVERSEIAFKLIYTAPLEVFFAYLSLSLFGGFMIAFPLIAWQVYAFIAPGLYKNERMAVLPFMAATPVLFAAGAAFVYYVMMPLLSRFALSFAQPEAEGVAQIDPQIKVSEYLSLVMKLIIAFGVCFQLPVVLSLMGRAGMVGADSLRKGRKYAVVGILAVAMLMTPPDVVSQILLTIPVYILYEISIFIVARFEKKLAEEEAAREGR